jgi:hypothetical protein
VITLGCRLRVSRAFAEKILPVLLDLQRAIVDPVQRAEEGQGRDRAASSACRSDCIARVCAAYIPLAVGWVAFNATPLASRVGDGSKIKSGRVCLCLRADSVRWIRGVRGFAANGPGEISRQFP